MRLVGPVGYRPPTIREVSERIATWEDFRVLFYDWLDDFYRYPGERRRMVYEEIVPMFDRRAAAFMAAAVHHLCETHGTPVPDWVFDDKYCLGDPWFYLPEVNLRAVQVVESPGAFRARNIFVFANVLERA